LDINRSSSFEQANNSGQLPVFYINHSGEYKQESQGIGPQYPSLKLDVSYYQKEAADIMEESIEEKRRASLRDSKIKKRLTAATKKDNLEKNGEEIFKIQI
jgi:hypothetical protein